MPRIRSAGRTPDRTQRDTVHRCTPRRSAHWAIVRSSACSVALFMSTTRPRAHVVLKGVPRRRGWPSWTVHQARVRGVPDVAASPSPLT